MSHQHGAYLGGIRTVEDLRQRCRVDDDTGCWHWGLSKGDDGRIWCHFRHDGKQIKTTGRRAALLLAGKTIAPKHVVFPTRACTSDDCVNPEHCRSSTRANHGQYMRATGRAKTPAKSASARALAHARRKLTWDQVHEIRASDETQAALALRFGVSQFCIWSIVSGRSWKQPASSVFTFRPELLRRAA